MRGIPVPSKQNEQAMELNDATDLAQLGERLFGLFDEAGRLLDASSISEDQRKKMVRCWADIYRSNCDFLAIIGAEFPHLDPYSLQEIRRWQESRRSNVPGKAGEDDQTHPMQD